jgi:acetyl-CoA carboxylase biotin carboxylase subunit
MDYDPLLAKLAVQADSRDAAIRRLIRAIAEAHVGGIATNLPFFQELLPDEEFRRGNLHTGFISEWLQRRRSVETMNGDAIAALAAVVMAGSAAVRPRAQAARASQSSWVRDGRSAMMR